MCARAQSRSEHQGSPELLRIHLLRTRVNKGKKKGRSPVRHDPPPLSSVDVEVSAYLYNGGKPSKKLCGTDP